MVKKNEVRFSDLSTPVKIAIIGAWIGLVYFAVSFTVGFVIGLTSTPMY